MSKSKFATIHGGLLVRKGQAAPAIRPTVSDVSYVDAEARAAPQSAPQHPRPAMPPKKPAPVGNRPVAAARELRERSSEPVEFRRPTEKPCPAPKSNGRSCVQPLPVEKRPNRGKGTGSAASAKATVRLTAQQKQVMKLAAAALGRSQQQIISDAVDAYLAGLGTGEMNACACFRQQLETLEATPDHP